MLVNMAKTVMFLAIMTALFVAVGSFFGPEGMRSAFIMALIMNAGMYYFSDKIVLSMHRARPLDRGQYPDIYDMVAGLAQTMQLPQPKLWLIDSRLANAFATGRNPQHASVALTTSILDILDEDELEGVLAHELSHIKNRDIFISTMAATMATAISYLGYMLRTASLYHRNDNREKPTVNPLALFVIGVTIPFIATLVQLAISRSREYEADDCGAHATREPLALASALRKLQQHANSAPQEYVYNPGTALGIVHPFHGVKMIDLLSTHPPMSERIKRLEMLQQKLFQKK